MAGTTEALLRQMREARRSWVQLDDSLSVCLERPADLDIDLFLNGLSRSRGEENIELVARYLTRYVVDWRGFSSSVLLGDAVGSSDQLPFDKDVWAEALRDNTDWLNKLSDALMNAITSYRKDKEATRGN